MRPDAAARRYARALFELGAERDEIERVRAALAAVVELLDDEHAARVLTGPIAQRAKRDLLRAIAGSVSAPAALQDLLLLLAERDRLRHLGAIRVVFERLVDRRQGRTRATVRTAVPLEADLLTELTQVFARITGKQVIVEVVVDPDLLGGAVVEIEGRVYDGSIRARLAQLREQMASGS